MMKGIIDFAETVTGDTRERLGYSDQDFEVLGRSSRSISGWAQDFGAIYADSVFGEATQREKSLLDAQSQAFAIWYETLASGKPDASFWAETCLMGLEHAVLGIHNRHVVAMASRVKQEFLTRSVLGLGIESAMIVYASFARIVDLAVGCMVDSYHNAILAGMADIGLNERLVGRVRSVSIRKMIDQAREGLPLIEWNDSLSVGIPTIDEQHKRLVVILNSLKASKASGADSAQLGRLLSDLAEYTVHHFGTEERLMEAHDYPELDEHRRAHEALLAQVGRLREDFSAGKAKLTAELFLFLRTWLNGHIRGTDRRYGPYLAERGVH